MTVGVVRTRSMGNRMRFENGNRFRNGAGRRREDHDIDLGGTSVSSMSERLLLEELIEIGSSRLDLPNGGSCEE